MLSSNDFLDKGTIAGFSALAGLTLGIGLTATIAKLVNDSRMDTEQKKRNLIGRKELIRNPEKDDGYDVVETYLTRLTPLFETIQEQYGIDKRNEFEQLVSACALPTTSMEKNGNNDELVHVPDLSQGLAKRNGLKGSGIELSIIEIFYEYKKVKNAGKVGIDINVVMMQILQNIIILYKEFLDENKMISEESDPGSPSARTPEVERQGKLETVNKAMQTFVCEIANTSMFRDRDFKLFQWSETNRQKNLPKIAEIIGDMGREAVAFQKKLTVVDRSNEKFRKIWNMASHFAQSLERMSEAEMYRLPSIYAYTPYKRKNRIIRYDIQSRNDITSDSDDLMANVVIRHMRNAYATFFADNDRIAGSSEFCYLNYLFNVTDENSFEREEGTIQLPRIASVTTAEGEFSIPLNEDQVRDAMPAINRFLKYLYVAAAMQADLSARLVAHGAAGQSRSAEYYYREQLIGVFMDRARQVANHDILGKTSYFKGFIDRMNDPAFIAEALDGDERFYVRFTKDPNIIEEDRDRQYGSTPNRTFNVSLNHMLHAKAMKKAGDEWQDMERINRQFSALIESAGMMPDTVCYRDISSPTINSEFLYNIALACQDDDDLKGNIMRIGHHADNSRIIMQYIGRLDKIRKDMTRAIEVYNFPDMKDLPILGTGYATVESTLVSAGTAGYQSWDIKYGNLEKLMLFLSNESGKKDALFYRQIYAGNLLANKKYFHNKESVVAYKNKLVRFMEAFDQSFSDILGKEQGKAGRHAFFTYFREKFVHLINDIDEFNKNVAVSEAEFERLRGERQKAEFEQTLSEMQTMHEIRMNDLRMRIETYQGSQREIIGKLFSSSNRILEQFVQTISEQTKKYGEALQDAAIDVESSVNSSFAVMRDGMSRLVLLQDELYQSFDSVLASTGEGARLSDAAIDTNDQLLVQVDRLTTLLNHTVPEMIDSILSAVTSSTEEITGKYRLEITRLSAEVENAEASGKMLRQQRDEADIHLASLTGQVNLQAGQLDAAHAELETQRTSIEKVNHELVELMHLADKLSGMVESEEYIRARNIVSEGLEKFLKSGSDRIRQEYSENGNHVDAEVHEILSSYNRLVTMISLAEETSVTIRNKIQEIITLNSHVHAANTSVVSTMDEMRARLNDQKNIILALRTQVDRLQVMHDVARSSHLASLKSQIEMMKHQEQTIMQLNAEIKSRHERSEAMMEQANTQLRGNVESLRQKNDELREANLQLTAGNLQLNSVMNKMASRHRAEMESLQESIEEQEKRIQGSAARILAGTLKQFDELAGGMLYSCERTIGKMTSKQKKCEARLRELDDEMASACGSGSVLPDAFPIDRKGGNEQISMKQLMAACRDLVKRVNRENAGRLRDGTDNGRMKWGWIQALTREMQDENMSPEDFLHSFRSLLIVYLQNKDGNRWYNASKTATGKTLLECLNDSEFASVRRLVFDSNAAISYDQLAGGLQDVASLHEKAGKLINPENRQQLTLTIGRFRQDSHDSPEGALSLLMKNERSGKLDLQKLDQMMKLQSRYLQEREVTGKKSLLLSNRIMNRNAIRDLVGKISGKMKSIEGSVLNLPADNISLQHEWMECSQELHAIREAMQQAVDARDIIHDLERLDKKLDGMTDKGNSIAPVKKEGRNSSYQGARFFPMIQIAGSHDSHDRDAMPKFSNDHRFQEPK